MSNIDEAKNSRLSPWIIRFEINGKNMIGKSLSIQQIESKLYQDMEEDNISIVRHFDVQGLDKIVMRLRLPEFGEDMDDEETETTPMFLK